MKTTFGQVRLGARFKVHDMQAYRTLSCVKVREFTIENGEMYNAVQIQPMNGVGRILFVDDNMSVIPQILKPGRMWATEEGIVIKRPLGWNDENIDFTHTPIDRDTYQRLRLTSAFAV